MIDADTLNTIIEGTKIAAAGTTILGAIILSIGDGNAGFLYRERKKDYERQQEGNARRQYHLNKPKYWEAFKDSLAFEWEYLKSCGKVTTSNYDFELRLKQEVNYSS